MLDGSERCYGELGSSSTVWGVGSEEGLQICSEKMRNFWVVLNHLPTYVSLE